MGRSEKCKVKSGKWVWEHNSLFSLFTFHFPLYFLFWCLFTCALLRTAWIICVDTQPIADMGWYYEHGLRIAHGLGYTENGRPTAAWPVGYPAFLGLIFYLSGDSILVAKLANVLLYTGMVWLSFLIARSIFPWPRTAPLTALVLTLYPNHIAYSSVLASEPLFCFLFLLGTWLMIQVRRRGWYAVPSGIAFGLAMLTRSQGVLAAAVVICSLLIARGEMGSPRRRLQLAGLVVAVMVLTILPNAIRNYSAMGRFIWITDNGAVNLRMGNNPYATGMYFYNRDVELLPDDRQGYAYMLRHPIRTVLLWPRKLRYLFLTDVDGISYASVTFDVDPNNRDYLKRFVPLKAVAELYYGAMMLAFAAFAWLYVRHRRTNKWIGTVPTAGLWMVIATAGLHLLYYGAPRYHYPLMPWIAMYAVSLPEMLRRMKLLGVRRLNAAFLSITD